MEEICDLLAPELDKQVREMNTMSYHEFTRFMPLFQKDGASRLGVDEYKNLGDEWSKRVSTSDRVDIIDPSFNGDDNILFSLPPIFSKLNAINEAGDGAERVTDYFADTLVRDTRFNGEMTQSLNLMVKAIGAAQGPIKNRAESIKEYVLLRARIEGKVNNLEQPASEQESTSDFVWE